MQERNRPHPRATTCPVLWCSARHAAPGPDTRHVVHTTQTMTSRASGDRMRVRLVWSQSLLVGALSADPKVVLSVAQDHTDPTAEPLPAAAIELSVAQAATLARVLRAVHTPDLLANVLELAVQALSAPVPDPPARPDERGVAR